MTEQTVETVETPQATETHEPVGMEALFEESEIQAFDDEDVEAGRRICTMLSLLFFYTVIVMSISLGLTLYWIYG